MPLFEQKLDAYKILFPYQQGGFPINMVVKVQSSIGKGFKRFSVCFLAQGETYGQNIVWNFYPKVNDSIH